MELSFCSDDEAFADSVVNPAASAEFRKLPNKRRKVKDGDAFTGIGVNSMAEAFQWHLHLVRACASEYGDACVDLVLPVQSLGLHFYVSA